MRTLILPSASRAAQSVAQFIARAIAEKPDLVLGLATGRTMIPVYEALVRLHRGGKADFSRVTTFNLDEFLELPPGHRGSYRSFMDRYLFRAVGLPSGSTHFPDDPRNPASYDGTIANAGGLDLCLVGIGTNGHVGFNEPGALLPAKSHGVRLRQATRRANAYLFSGQIDRVPRKAISMGIGTIFAARIVIMLVTGDGKATVVRKALEGPVTTRVPGSLIQTHPSALVVLDRAAARFLSLPAKRRDR